MVGGIHHDRPTRRVGTERNVDSLQRGDQRLRILPSAEFRGDHGTLQRHHRAVLNVAFEGQRFVGAAEDVGPIGLLLDDLPPAFFVRVTVRVVGRLARQIWLRCSYRAFQEVRITSTVHVAAGVADHLDPGRNAVLPQGQRHPCQVARPQTVDDDAIDGAVGRDLGHVWRQVRLVLRHRNRQCDRRTQRAELIGVRPELRLAVGVIGVHHRPALAVRFDDVADQRTELLPSNRFEAERVAVAELGGELLGSAAERRQVHHLELQHELLNHQALGAEHRAHEYVDLIRLNQLGSHVRHLECVPIDATGGVDLLHRQIGSQVHAGGDRRAGAVGVGQVADLDRRAVRLTALRRACLAVARRGLRRGAAGSEPACDHQHRHYGTKPIRERHHTLPDRAIMVCHLRPIS